MNIIKKKIKGMIGLACLILALSGISVQAAGIFTVNGANGEPVRYSEGVIEKTAKASLTVYKYEYDGEGNDSNGQYQPTLPEGAKPFAGVVFKYLKIADFSQDSTGGTANMKYNVTTAIESLGITPGLYTSNELMAKLEAVNAEGAEAKKKALEIFVNTNGTAMSATDSNGKSVASNLDLGLYLLVETNVPGTVAVRSNPCMLSLPMTNAGQVDKNGTIYAPGSLWQYDVYVQPKNKIQIPEITKNIVKGDKLEKFDSVNIGDKVTYEIKSDIPSDSGRMSKYDIKDTLSQGLTFDGIMSVKVEGKEIMSMDKINSILKKSGANNETITLQFINSSENLLKDYSGKELVITYRAILNEKANLTESGNPNDASLIFNHNAGLETNTEDVTVDNPVDPVVYTYGIDIMKIDEKNKPLAGVEFELYTETGTTPIKMTKGTSTNTSYAGVNSYYPNASSSNVKIVTGSNGQAYIFGLAPGTYYLKETKAAPGSNLLPDRIKIVVREEVTYNLNAEKGTYCLIDNTVAEYYRLRYDGSYSLFTGLDGYRGQYVNLGTNKVFMKGSAETYTKVTNLYLPTVKISAEAAKPYGASNMTVQLKVVNNSAFILPKTGGVGTYVLTLGGVVIVLATVGIAVIRRKKRSIR